MPSGSSTCIEEIPAAKFDESEFELRVEADDVEDQMTIARSGIVSWFH